MIGATFSEGSLSLSVDLPHIYTVRVIISTTRPFRAATTIENQQDAICHLDSVLISNDLY